MGSSHSHSGAHDSSVHHHVSSTATNLKVFGLLILATILTVVAPSLHLGALGPVVAFAIASFKAFLVLAYFMHLKYDDKLNIVIIGSTLFFLALLIAFVVLDMATRVSEVSPL